VSQKGCHIEALDILALKSEVKGQVPPLGGDDEGRYTRNSFLPVKVMQDRSASLGAQARETEFESGEKKWKG
jgi:hypothetical protein